MRPDDPIRKPGVALTRRSRAPTSPLTLVTTGGRRLAIRHPRAPWRRWVTACVGLGLALSVSAQEVELAADDKKNTDPFEEHSLAKADKLFKEKQYRAAAAEYDSFILEFPQSRVLPYALFRKARAIDLDNKRFDAIAKYKEVLDYFPNAIAYAAPALYYMGVCYMQTGDPESAVKTWTEMVKDEDYRRHPLAASALNLLAENFAKQKLHDSAMVFYEQVVTDFRAANWDAASAAMWQVIEYRMKTVPNEAALRAFYVKVGGFERAPAKLEADLAAYPPYWNFIRAQVRTYGRGYPDLQNEARHAFYKYWTSALEGKFPAADDFQIDLIDFRFAYENDPAARIQRLDAQFAKYQKPDDYERVIKWINLFMGNKAKIDEYYGKLDLAKLGATGVEKLVFALLGQKEYAMALNAFEKLPLNTMNDAARAQLSRALWPHVQAGFSVTALVRLAESFTDRDYGHMTLLRYYYGAGQTAAGIPLAEKLSSLPAYAPEALYIWGDLLCAARQYEQAIQRYQQANNPPTNQYRIAECYTKLAKLDSAVGALREIENFFPKEAPRAALMIAHLFRDGGQQDKYTAALRAVLKKYPGSGESSAAHQELEKLGVRIGGGVDAEP